MDKFVGVLTTILNGVLGLFPAWSLPLTPEDIGASVGTGVQIANGFFPVTTLAACLAAVAGVWLVLAGWKLVLFVYDLIPFKMT